MIGRIVAAAYVLTVALVATIGFVTDSTAPILLAGAAGLPFSIPAIAGFYMAYGLLAQVPGANPSNADLAPWFVFTTDVIGVVALTAAAVVNVVVIRWLLQGRRAAATRNRPAG